MDTTSAKWLPGGAEICGACLAVERPALMRVGCVCQKGLRAAIEEELAAAVVAMAVTMREGRVDQYLSLHKRSKVATATVADVISAVEEGPEIFKAKTWQAYRASLRRMAAVVSPLKPDAVLLSEVLTEDVVRVIQCAAQGVGSARELNLMDKLDCNGGPNTVLRNVKSLFGRDACHHLFARLAMPNLDRFMALPYLPTPEKGFVPWEPSVWAGFVEASEALRETRPVLWAVNAWLRRTGLRDKELLSAKRSWIELVNEKPVLFIQSRGAEFSLLKRGKGRRIGVDAELWALVRDLPADAWLVGEGLSPSQRYDLIYRDHCAFVAQFIPGRQKRNHEMRMMAGSIMYEKHGLAVAADFLGDTMETTRAFYATRLTASEALDGRAVDRKG